MKKIVILFLLFFFLTACGEKKEEVADNNENEVVDYETMTDDVFLMTVNKFEEDGYPNVIWIFNQSSLGKISTDGGDSFYDMKWSLKNDKLIVDVEWIYNNKKEYSIKFDKKNVSFTLDNDTKFVKADTQEKNEPKYSKLSLLKGAWEEKTDKGIYMWYFDSKECSVGYYNEKMYISDKYNWNVVNDTIELIASSGKKIIYDYILDDDTFIIYQNGDVIHTFIKSDYVMK